MKFMKLGSKPDTFQGDGKCIRYVSSDLATDIIINVGEVKFYLHKFPLLSKSNYMQQMVQKANEDNCDEIQLADCPGGPRTFELCAKFCYGMTVTLNAHNVVAARCAAEYLEMTEDVDRGNLIFKIEVFLNSSIFRSWKDSIILLQTSKSLLPWSEDLKIVGRCIDSIASKISVEPSLVTWSYTNNRKLALEDEIVDKRMKFQEAIESVPKDWWVEDICELEIDLYKRVMVTVKCKGRVDGYVICEALKTYAIRWLPDSVDALVSDMHAKTNKLLVETIICLLPSDKAVGCSCSFLLKLLKVSILVEVDESSKEDLLKRISFKLHEASVSDLMIPARSPQATRYDTELVNSIVKEFVAGENHSKGLDVSEKNDRGIDDNVSGHDSLVSVGKLIDEYLAEVAHDPALDLSSFVDMLQSLPASARPIHDGLYKAVDIYLKEHPCLTKFERKKVCGLIDVKKLTMEASMHAAQNERLPLRVIVQVLFFEQIRVAAGIRSQDNCCDISRSTTNTDEDWEKTATENIRSQMKINDEDAQKKEKLAKNNSKDSRSGLQLLPSRSRRIFDKLWLVGKGNGDSKSSETSESSRSQCSMVPGDMKSLGSSSRCRRHSIS